MNQPPQIQQTQQTQQQTAQVIQFPPQQVYNTAIESAARAVLEYVNNKRVKNQSWDVAGIYRAILALRKD